MKEKDEELPPLDAHDLKIQEIEAKIRRRKEVQEARIKKEK